MTNQTKLKYLFEAEYFDGSIYKQNKDDASIKYPPQKIDGVLQGKSCMSDIQEDIDEFRLKRFTLVEQSLFGKRISVDLTNGKFNVDGTEFIAEGERQIVGQCKYKLIFYRIRQQQVGVNRVGEMTDLGELPIQFMIGWQAKISGKTYTQKIIIK